MKIIRLFVNIVCCLIPGTKARNIMRIKINHRRYLGECIKFAVAHTDGKRHKIKIDVEMYSKSLILLVDNLYAFKFPLNNDGYNESIREKRITDTFSGISPIKIPKIDILRYQGMTVRKYEFADGILLKNIKREKIMQNREKISSQIANFIFEIGRADPSSISDLKPHPNKKPSFLYGWFHNNITENFIIDPQTFNIQYVINWADADFVNFKSGILQAWNNWDKLKCAYMMNDVICKYVALYKKYCDRG